jgi:hypothetical protein
VDETLGTCPNMDFSIFLTGVKLLYSVFHSVIYCRIDICFHIRKKATRVFSVCSANRSFFEASYYCSYSVRQASPVGTFIAFPSDHVLCLSHSWLVFSVLL